jgi:hypothetical protein
MGLKKKLTLEVAVFLTVLKEFSYNISLYKPELESTLDVMVLGQKMTS